MRLNTFLTNTSNGISKQNILVSKRLIGLLYSRALPMIILKHKQLFWAKEHSVVFTKWKLMGSLKHGSLSPLTPMQLTVSKYQSKRALTVENGTGSMCIQE